MFHPKQQEIPEWQGADTVITSNFSPREPHMMDHDLVARTIHAKRLTWLFFELRDTFSDLLDPGNKYRFFESLTQAAIDHLAANQPECEDHRPLLSAVLVGGFAFLGEVRDHGQVVGQSPVVVHHIDKEGRQQRESPDTQ